MKKMLTLIALIAAFAMSTGCSENGSLLGPETINTADFPDNGNGEGNEIEEVAAPTNLAATQKNGKITLTWEHSSVDGAHYRVYRAQSAAGFELVRTSSACEFEDQLGRGWTKVIYRVTALSDEGAESDFSDALAVYEEPGVGQIPGEMPVDEEWF